MLSLVRSHHRDGSVSHDHESVNLLSHTIHAHTHAHTGQSLMASWSIHDNAELTSKYQILGHIGSGSYADVYRARRKADGFEVALKEVHDYQSACREIEALSNLVGHPHVVQLLEYLWLSDDSVVLVLEFLCSDLSAVISRRRKKRHPSSGDVKESFPYVEGADPDMEANSLHMDDAPGMEANLLHMDNASDIEARSAFGMQGFDVAFYVEASSHDMAYENPDSDGPTSEDRVHCKISRDLPISHSEQVNPSVQDIVMDARDELGSLDDNKSEVTSDEKKQQDPFAEAEVKGWMLQLLKGVASCHSEGFLHRDLKPSNMLISASGVLKIADFGQARVLGPHGKVSSLPMVNNDEGIYELPQQASDQREPIEEPEPREASKIVSLVTTFHKETVERRMDVEDAEISSSLLFIKGIAEKQSQESSLHVIHDTQKTSSLSPICEEPLVPESLTNDDGAISKKSQASFGQGNHDIGAGFMGDCQTESPKTIGKYNQLHSSINYENVLCQPCSGEEFGFGLAEVDESRDQAWIGEPNWTSNDLVKFKWTSGEDYSYYAIDHEVSENSAEFGSEARFYKEDATSEYTGCIGTRWYRAPELLYGATTYGMGVDMWAVGCLFGELLSGKPVFPGCSDIDQLSRIVRVLGNPDEESWPGVSKLPDYGKISFADDRNGYSLRQHIKEGSEEAHDLLSKLITYNPESRLSAADALKHPYFQVQPHPMAAGELRAPSPCSLPCRVDDDSMGSF